MLVLLKTSLTVFKDLTADPELIREAGVKNFKAFPDRPQPRVRTGPPVDMQFQNSGILSAKCVGLYLHQFYLKAASSCSREQCGAFWAVWLACLWCSPDGTMERESSMRAQKWF